MERNLSKNVRVTRKLSGLVAQRSGAGNICSFGKAEQVTLIVIPMPVAVAHKCDMGAMIAGAIVGVVPAIIMVRIPPTGLSGSRHGERTQDQQ